MPREWLTGGSYQNLQDRLARKKEQIEQAFFVPLFELITQQTKQMTAFEVQQRVAEKGALFHPIFVRTVTEKLTPTNLLTLDLSPGVVNSAITGPLGADLILFIILFQ